MNRGFAVLVVVQLMLVVGLGVYSVVTNPNFYRLGVLTYGVSALFITGFAWVLYNILRKL